MMTVLAVITGFIALAKRGRGKRRPMGRYIRGNVDEEVAATALAPKDVVSAIFDETVNERTLVSSIVATYAMGNFTAIANCGPIVVGVAHSDYNDAEIEEFLEDTGQWNEGDLIAREKGARKIRQIGSFDTPQAVEDAVVLNDGKAIKTKLNWILLQGQTLRLWVYNSGSAAVATTAPAITANGHANLFPK